MTGQTFYERDQSRRICGDQSVTAVYVNHLDSPDSGNHEQHEGCGGDHPRNIARLYAESVFIS